MQRRIVLHVTLIVVAVLLAVTAPASAHVSWCSSDPVVVLPDGSVVNVIVEAPIENIGSHVAVGILAQQGSELTEVIHGDLVLHPSFAAGLQNPNFLVLSRPIGNFPLRVTVLRDNVVVQVKEGTPGAVVGMWLQF
jgi:hypothetical protein